MKKKKQAAKRKSIAAEDTEMNAENKAVSVRREDGLLGARTAQDKTGPKRVVGDRNSAVAADEEIKDASSIVAAEGSLTGADTGVDTGVSPGTVRERPSSVPRNSLPIPPAAPSSNGERTSLRSSHKKTVSFVMDGGDMEALLGDKSDSDVLLPHVLPVPQCASSANRTGGGGNDDAAGATEAFLRRNFMFGEDSQQVMDNFGSNFCSV